MRYVIRLAPQVALHYSSNPQVDATLFVSTSRLESHLKNRSHLCSPTLILTTVLYWQWKVLHITCRCIFEVFIFALSCIITSYSGTALVSKLVFHCVTLASLDRDTAMGSIDVTEMDLSEASAQTTFFSSTEPRHILTFQTWLPLTVSYKRVVRMGGTDY